MAKTPCIRCGALVDYRASRRTGRAKRRSGMCDECAARQPLVTHAETMRRAQVVAMHRAAHGDWCSGWQRSSHQATDLTADHVDSVAAGGSEYGALVVLCRSCNSAKREQMAGD